METKHSSKLKIHKLSKAQFDRESNAGNLEDTSLYLIPEQPLTIQLNTGTTEGTNKFTYDGSEVKTVNITPSAIGAAASSHGTHVSFTTTTPKANGTAAVGTATTVSRSDHVHPTDTSRAPMSHASSATTYGVGTTADYGHVKTQTGDMNGTSSTNGIAAGLGHTHSQYWEDTEEKEFELYDYFKVAKVNANATITKSVTISLPSYLDFASTAALDYTATASKSSADTANMSVSITSVSVSAINTTSKTVTVNLTIKNSDTTQSSLSGYVFVTGQFIAPRKKYLHIVSAYSSGSAHHFMFYWLSRSSKKFTTLSEFLTEAKALIGGAFYLPASGSATSGTYIPLYVEMLTTDSLSLTANGYMMDLSTNSVTSVAISTISSVVLD